MRAGLIRGFDHHPPADSHRGCGRTDSRLRLASSGTSTSLSRHVGHQPLESIYRWHVVSLHVSYFPQIDRARRGIQVLRRRPRLGVAPTHECMVELVRT